MITARSDINSAQQQDSVNHWLPLWLLIAAMLIPLVGGTAWKYRTTFMCAYHFSRLQSAMDKHDEANLARHLYALYAMDPAALAQKLRKAVNWPLWRRRQVAELLMEHRDFLQAQSRYDPYDTMSRVFGVLQLWPAAVKPKISLDLILDLDPSNQDALRLKAESLYLKGDYRNCARILACLTGYALAEDNTGSDRDYMLWGSALYNLDLFREAGEKFAMAAQMRPRSFMAMAAISRTLAKRGRYADAVRVCTRMMKLAQPRIPSAMPNILMERAQMLGLLNLHESAIRDLNAALILASRQRFLRPSELFGLRLKKARAFLNMHKPEAALRELDILYREEPTDVDVLSLRGSALADLGKYREAEKSLREALLTRATSPYIHNHLAWMLATAKNPAFRDPQEALRLARKAFDLDHGRSPAIMDTLAEAYYVNRMFTQAIKYETMAVKKGGDSYLPSLQRFQKAMARSRSGEKFDLTPSPLIDHEKLPQPKPGQKLDLETIDAPPRVSLELYRSRIGRSLGSPRKKSLDTFAMELADLWERSPASAIDDPKADFYAISIALLQLRWTPRSTATSADRRFLLGLASSLSNPSRTAAGVIMKRRRGGNATSSEIPEIAFASRLSRLVMRRLTRKQTGNLLHRIADNSMLFTQFYDLGYYDAKFNRPGKRPSAAEINAAWQKIKSRILAAANGKNLRQLRLDSGSPDAGTARERIGLVPPPDD